MPIRRLKSNLEYLHSHSHSYQEDMMHPEVSVKEAKLLDLFQISVKRNLASTATAQKTVPVKKSRRWLR